MADKKLPNTDYLQIWLQRISLNYNIKHKYEAKLCKLVINDVLHHIWNNKWIKGELKKIIDDKDHIINIETIKKLPPTMQKGEIGEPFYNW